MKTNLSFLAKEKNYRKLFLAGIICRFADSLDVLVYSWMTYIITGSASIAAVVYASNQIPTVIFQPIAGTLVEKFNKKKVYVITNVLRAALIVIVFGLFLFGNLNVLSLVLTTFFVSVLEAFNSPASTSMVPLLLDKELFSIALSISASLNAIASLLGTVFGGILIGLWGIEAALVTDGILFGVAAVCVGTIRSKNLETKKFDISFSSIKDDFFQGFGYIKQNTEAIDFCTVAFLINLSVVPLNSLLAPLVDLLYSSGSELISIIGAMVIIGNCIGPILCRLIAGKRTPIQIYTSGGICIGLLIALYSLGAFINLANFGAILFCGSISLLLGIVLSIVSTMLSIRLVESVNPDYMARISSLMNAIGSLANPMAALFIAILTVSIDVEYLFILWGGICIIGFLINFNKKRWRHPL